MPSKEVAEYVNSQHEYWLSTRKSVKSDSSIRKSRIEVNDPNNYENNWALFER